MSKLTSFPVIRIRPKSIGALPVGLKGKLYGQPFKVVIQYDAFGGVRAQVIEDEPGGGMITEVTGRTGEAPGKADGLSNWAFSRYKKEQGSNWAREADKRDIQKRSEAFIKNLFGEVKDFNSGKDTKTKKSAPIIVTPKKVAIIKKTTTPKKVEVVKKVAAKKYNLNPKLDAKRSAELPGKRKSATNKTYYEYRVNRTDQKGKKI